MAHTYLATWQSEGLYLALPCRVGERRASVRQRDAKQFLQAEPASRPRASTIEFHLPKAAKRPGLTQALGPMKTLIVALCLLLCACTTPRLAGQALTLRLDSYDQSSGKFALTLSNNSEREALYLFYFIEFSKDLPRGK